MPARAGQNRRANLERLWFGSINQLSQELESDEMTIQELPLLATDFVFMGTDWLVEKCYELKG